MYCIYGYRFQTHWEIDIRELLIGDKIDLHKLTRHIFAMDYHMQWPEESEMDLPKNQEKLAQNVGLQVLGANDCTKIDFNCYAKLLDIEDTDERGTNII